ncbi:MAG: hypothetical protein ACR2PQ_03490 [Myxococcota bacterium]
MLWVASTTKQGRRLRSRLGIGRGSGAPQDDREYLLRVCDGDRDRVSRLLDHERRGQPEMTEAQAYRRAIRRHLRDRM